MWDPFTNTTLRQVGSPNTPDRRIANNGDNTMSEIIQPAELTPEEIRIRERRSFDAFNEAQAARRKNSRDLGAGRDAEETKRWTKHEPDANASNEVDEHNSPGG